MFTNVSRQCNIAVNAHHAQREQRLLQCELRKFVRYITNQRYPRSSDILLQSCNGLLKNDCGIVGLFAEEFTKNISTVAEPITNSVFTLDLDLQNDIVEKLNHVSVTYDSFYRVIVC